jgi:hypothetical protein
MKSIKINPTDKTIRAEYPHLGTPLSGDYVVLFLKPGTGTVIWTDPQSVHKLGEISGDWAMHCFKPWDGQITLRND